MTSKLLIQLSQRYHISGGCDPVSNTGVLWEENLALFFFGQNSYSEKVLYQKNPPFKMLILTVKKQHF